jgi:hypothetical protein
MYGPSSKDMQFKIQMWKFPILFCRSVHYIRPHNRKFSWIMISIACQLCVGVSAWQRTYH